MKSLRWLLIFIFYLFNSNCFGLNEELPTKSECDVLVKTFFRLTHKEQLEQFSVIGVDRKYVIYICGMRAIYPQTLHLADAFSKEGEFAFPFLAKKILKTQSDTSFREILYVLSEMQRRKTYDVVSEKALMLYVEKRATEIQDKFWREYAQKLVIEMQRGANLSNAPSPK